MRHCDWRIVGRGLLLAVLSFISCSDDGVNTPFTPPRTYYSLEEALKEPENVRTMFLVEIGDSLSPDIGQLTRLQDLRIGRSDLRFLPQEITNLPELRTLSLFDCAFDHIPAQIMQIPSLTSLYITGCQLKNIPEGFGEVENIHYLLLGDNLLSEIPRGVLCTRECYMLSLDSNKLTEFNFTLDDFPKLKFLSLEGNLFSDSVKKRIYDEFKTIEILEM
jgi:Leucine-rich repeat (LRR) protein